MDTGPACHYDSAPGGACTGIGLLQPARQERKFLIDDIKGWVRRIHPELKSLMGKDFPSPHQLSIKGQDKDGREGQFCSLVSCLYKQYGVPT